MQPSRALQDLINTITPLDEDAVKAARARLDSLAKPPGSLGVLEDIAAQLAGITGKVRNYISKGAVIALCADNGVVEEGVASAPQSVTLAQTINFARGLTGVAVLAKEAGADLYVVDVGVNADIDNRGVLNRKIRKGTGNIRKEVAMTPDEAMRAILVGAKTAELAVKEGAGILGAGEMGIGNTTTSSAVLVAMTGCSTEFAVGRGGGIDDAAYARKKQVVADAVALHKPDPHDALDILHKVGGLDIAAMVGVYLAAAKLRVPVVIDGFISAAAAALAVMLAPEAKSYMLASHLSTEPGYRLLITKLGLIPMLNLNMRLGEGSGCPLAFSLVRFSCAMMNNMATFEEALIDDSYLADIDENSFDAPPVEMH